MSLPEEAVPNSVRRAAWSSPIAWIAGFLGQLVHDPDHVDVALRSSVYYGLLVPVIVFVASAVIEVLMSWRQDV
ncbi:hypothetical protein KNE206_30220 [Kitasatospora sp. NE20-6]|uniref:hypothetical protein n=1 Tax=Kitasatospora sp. NE20-6 TaxID=2859066 RepID=UPI0034DC8EE6